MRVFLIVEWLGSLLQRKRPVNIYTNVIFIDPLGQLCQSLQNSFWQHGICEESEGVTLDSVLLAPSQPRPPKISLDKMWPLARADADWFKREMIPATIPTTPLWISKADALPSQASIGSSQLIWTSGLTTWCRLARRGIWVNGCAEGLGEQNAPNIDTLAGAHVKWTKLTHTGAPVENGMSTARTYRLIPKADYPNLAGKIYFFWNSGSAFERALALDPAIKSMTHFCGPGNTQRTLEGHGVKPHVFLDHEQWLNEMSTE